MSFESSQMPSNHILTSFVQKFQSKHDALKTVAYSTNCQQRSRSVFASSIQYGIKQNQESQKNSQFPRLNLSPKLRKRRNLKRFGLLSNITKSQFSNYFFQRFCLEFCENSLLVPQKDILQKSHAKSVQPTFYPFTKIEKVKQVFPNFVLESYFQSFSQRKTVNTGAFAPALFDMDLNFMKLLLNFEILNKRSELIHFSPIQQKIKSYWISLNNVFQDSFFENVSSGSIFFSFLQRQMLHSDLEKAEKVLSHSKKQHLLEIKQRKTRLFYTYKNQAYLLMIRFSSELTLSLDCFSKRRLLKFREPVSIFELCNFSTFSGILDSTNRKVSDSMILFFGTNSEQLQSRMDHRLLSKIYENLKQENLSNLFLEWLHTSLLNSQKIAVSLKWTVDHNQTRQYSNRHKIQMLLFDKIKKQALIGTIGFWYTKNQSSLNLGHKSFFYKPSHSSFVDNFSNRICLFEFPLKKVFSFQWKNINRILFLDMFDELTESLYFLKQTTNQRHPFFILLSAFDDWLMKNKANFVYLEKFLMARCMRWDRRLMKSQNMMSLLGVHLNGSWDESLFTRKFYSDCGSLNFNPLNQFHVNLIYNSFGILSCFHSELSFFNYSKTLKGVIQKNSSAPQTLLIKKLNLKILAYSYYFYFRWDLKLFKKLDKQLVRWLWYWASRRHNNKSNLWIQKKYFLNIEDEIWVFGSVLDRTSQMVGVRRNVNKEQSQRNLDPFQISYLPTHYQLVSIFSLNNL